MTRFFVIFPLILIVSCSPIKNDFDQERFRTSRFTIKPLENVDVYKLIDTSSIYILNDIYNNGKLKVNIPQCLKFYKNNKVGKFKNYDIKVKESLNPKKAEMGFYKYSKNKLEIEFMSNSAQSGNFLVKKRIIIKGDKIIASYNGEFEYEYVKFKLTKDFLIFKPDW